MYKKWISEKLNLLKPVQNFINLKTLKLLYAIIIKYWLLFFFIISIAYLELIYRLQIFKGINADFIFPLLFSFSAGAVIFLIISLLPSAASKIVATVVSVFLGLVYGVQIIYYCIFRTPLSLYSIGGAGDAAQFSDIVAETVLKNIVVMVLLFVPQILLFIRRGKPWFEPVKKLKAVFILLFCAVFYSIAVISVTLTGDGPASQNTLYFKTFNPELSVNKLGLFTTMRQDLQKLVADSLGNSFSVEASAVSNMEEETAVMSFSEGTEEAAGQPGDIRAGSGGATTGSAFAPTGSVSAAATGTGLNVPEGTVAEGEAGSNVTGAAVVTPAVRLKPYNTMDIDFDRLIAASGKDEDMYAMNKYFSSVRPTATNRYTGMFKGDNLILITAEAFSPYFITPELTPTLYRMSTEGFVFRNFYNPVWGVSTSDGEYVADTGLIPKSGVWSFMKSGAINMPFCMGNQFRKLGYTTKAYHDHTYTYYKRDVSHPNMGYDYKGVGNGLVVKKTWPESDLEMINVTAGDFTPDKPFHIYYMTVSGHMNYSFTGNYMSSKNKEYVENLPYSDPSKAYIACNLELEAAMKALVGKLEDLGIAEKTVIAISGDHYPYGLPRECIDELAGHKVEDNFELYKSTFILWKKGSETVVVNKPCASLDRIPTLSNLFGLDYDSRLLMGTDILSDSPALVIFSNRSWITDRARYNTVTDKVEYFDGTTEDKAYIKLVNRVVADKFRYSAKILETDYYGKILKK